MLALKERVVPLSNLRYTMRDGAQAVIGLGTNVHSIKKEFKNDEAAMAGTFQLMYLYNPLFLNIIIYLLLFVIICFYLFLFVFIYFWLNSF